MNNITIDLSSLVFTPEDFSSTSVISLKELTSYIEKIINEIRSRNKDLDIYSKLDELQDVTKILDKTSFEDDDETKKLLLNANKRIQDISISLRKMLSEYLDLEIYDSIEYTFYYNQERYHTENLDLSWLRVGSKGTLKINLFRAVQDIKNKVEQTTLQKQINNHYKIFLQAIAGTYKENTSYELGEGRINEGHVAQAFELHLLEHHKNKQSSAGQQFIDIDDNLKIWSNHEKIDIAWAHIRAALGNQRGTVAADVGNTQVKAGSDYAQLRLVTIPNLKRGISLYQQILAPDIKSKDLAKKIAKYMSESIPKTKNNLLAYAASRDITEEIGKLVHI